MDEDCLKNSINIITVCNEVAKVMFLYLSISPSVDRVGRGSAPSHAGIHQPPSPGTKGRHPPPPGPKADTLPLSRRLLLWTVCILLECILVASNEHN